MRCPKCGYISFDRQRSCAKCSNDLTAVTEQLQGTVGKAAAPFFLGAVLGKQKPYEAEPGPALQEEEETIVLGGPKAEAPSADEEELDFAGAPLDEDDLEDQPLPSLGLEDIDVSDLMPPQEEEEEQVLSLGEGQEEALSPPPFPSRDEEEDSLTGIELPSLEPDDSLNLYGQESPFDLEEAEEPPAGAEEEEEEIIDLSALMDFEETPAPPAGEEKPETQKLSLEDGENASTPAEAPKKTASAVADIPDLGLTLENDDQ